MPETRPRPRRQPDPETDVAIALHQHQQELLEALDRLANYIGGYRANVAAGKPSIAIARQMVTDVGRVREETVAMVTLQNAAKMGVAAAEVEADVLRPRFAAPG